MKLYLPGNENTRAGDGTRGIFLAGPIQNAPNWQSRAIHLLNKFDINVFSPRKDVEREADFGSYEYDEQIEWEHYHLGLATKYGVTVFYLAKNISETPGRAYAQTSRYELAEAATLNRLIGTQLVVGIEEGFSGDRYIKKTLTRKNPTVKIFDNLEDTIGHAVKYSGVAQDYII